MPRRVSTALRSTRGPRPAALAVLVVSALAAGACTDPDAPYRVVAEEENLTRQVEDLRALVDRAEKGVLVPRDGLVVSVSEELVQRLIQLALPREDVLEGRFFVRLEKAEAHFEDGHGAVRLDGHVEWLDDTFGFRGEVDADLTVLGRVEAVAADTTEGTLTARVVPYGFEVHRLRVGDEAPRTRHFLHVLGRTLPGALSTLSTRLTIPVAFEREVSLDGIEAGPVSIGGASVPVRAAVREATAHGGRLWVSLETGIGRWTRPAR